MAYKTEKTIKEGIFLDIIPPKLNFFDIKLQHRLMYEVKF